MYYVYLIQCEGGSIYTGITTDLERRFKEHSDKIGGHYTSAHKVEKILYTEKYPTRSEALKREAEIKKFSRKEKLKLIETKSIRVYLLSLVKSNFKQHTVVDF